MIKAFSLVCQVRSRLLRRVKIRVLSTADAVSVRLHDLPLRVNKQFGQTLKLTWPRGHARNYLKFGCSGRLPRLSGTTNVLVLVLSISESRLLIPIKALRKAFRCYLNTTVICQFEVCRNLDALTTVAGIRSLSYFIVPELTITQHIRCLY